MDHFGFVGETLRRLRKERGKTLSELGAEACVGKGQLSRIENGHQEATLGTLSKILAAQGIGRREFFRRYDLVEAEAAAVGRRDEGGGRPSDPRRQALGDEVRTALDQVDGIARLALEAGEAVTQGTVEVGRFVIFFRVVARPGDPALGDPERSEGL